MRVHRSPVRLTVRGPHAHVWPNAGAAANGEHVMSHTRLGRKLKERGWRSVRETKGERRFQTMWEGLCVSGPA